jgi:hypothetical protein
MKALPSRESIEQQLRALAGVERHAKPLVGGTQITWQNADCVLARAFDYEHEETSFSLLDASDKEVTCWEGRMARRLLAIGCQEYGDPQPLPRESLGGRRPLDLLIEEAMEELPSLEQIGERLLALATSERGELVDFSFGDSELTWRAPGGWDVEEGDEDEDEDEDAPPNLGVGYDGGGGAEVSVLDENGKTLAKWEGEDAWPLLTLGRLHGRERNDESAELTPCDELYLAQREV